MKVTFARTHELEIFETLAKHSEVPLLKDKAYCRLVTKSYESLRELMEREVSSALTIPIYLGNSSVLIEQNVV